MKTGGGSDNSLTVPLLSQSFLPGSTKSPNQWVGEFDGLIRKTLKIVNRPGITRSSLLKEQRQVQLLVQWDGLR